MTSHMTHTAPYLRAEQGQDAGATPDVQHDLVLELCDGREGKRETHEQSVSSCITCG